MSNARVIRELRQMQGATRKQTNSLKETVKQREMNIATIECYKPLIFDFFTNAYDIAMQYTCKEQPSEYEHKEHNAEVEDNMILQSKNGKCTRYKFEPFALCPLTPSCNIPYEFRHYEENGHLNESESLFKKHAQESKFLLHVLPFIIEKLIKAHSLYANLEKLQHECEKHVNIKNKNSGSKTMMNNASAVTDSCDVSRQNVQTLSNSYLTEYYMYNNDDDDNNYININNEVDCDDNVLQGSVIYSAEHNFSALSEEHPENNNVICDECNFTSHNCASNTTDTTFSHNKTRRFHHIECLSSSDESIEEKNSVLIDNKNTKTNTTLIDVQDEVKSLSDVVITLSPITKEQQVSYHVCETSAHVNHAGENECCTNQEIKAQNNNETDHVEEEEEEEEFNEFEGFYTEAEPDLSMYDFMKRIILYTNLSPSSVIIGCIYLDRLLCSYVPLLINKLNVYMLLMSAIRVASKAYDIRIVGTIDFAKAINVDENDLVELEELMIERLHFNLYVAAEEFNKYAFHLIHAAAGDSLPNALEEWWSSYESCESNPEHVEDKKKKKEKKNTSFKGFNVDDENKLWCWEQSNRPKLCMMNNVNNSNSDAKVWSIIKELEWLSTPHGHSELSNTCNTEKSKLANSQTLSRLLPYSLLPPEQPASSMSISHLLEPNVSVALSDCDKSMECCNISSSNGLSYSSLINAHRASSNSTSMSLCTKNEKNNIIYNNNNNISFSVDRSANLKDAVQMLTQELSNCENATQRGHETNHVHSLHADALLPSQPVYFTLSEEKNNNLSSLKQLLIVTKYITCYNIFTATTTATINTECSVEKEEIGADKLTNKCNYSKVENKEKSTNTNKSERQQTRRRIKQKLRLPIATSPVKCTSPSLSPSALQTTRPPSSQTEMIKKIKQTPIEGKIIRTRNEATFHNSRYINESNESNTVLLPAIVANGIPQQLHDSGKELVNSHSLVFAGPTRPRANTIDTIEFALPKINEGDTSTMLSSSSSSATNTNNNNKSSRKHAVASSLILNKQTIHQSKEKSKYDNLYDKYCKTKGKIIINMHTKQDEQNTEKTRVRNNCLPPLATCAKPIQYN